jgi:hypothetical protein
MLGLKGGVYFSMTIGLKGVEGRYIVCIWKKEVSASDVCV